jgi:hypothetical protein
VTTECRRLALRSVERAALNADEGTKKAPDVPGHKSGKARIA